MMKDYKFTFVVLHYIAVEDTIECIESIKSNSKKCNYQIVIVDNASPNNTGILLRERYCHDSVVKVILNKSNMGFSKGNNIGINYAKKILKSDFVIVINNDTLIIQQDFLQKIIKEYENSSFSVLGPMVYDPDGLNNSSPLNTIENYNVENLYGNYKIWRRKYIKGLMGLENFHPFAKKINENKHTKIKNKINVRMVDIEIHGCCLIFSPNYFEYYSGFEELTFMYGEESILRINCQKKGLLIVYNPNLKIYHKEAVATNKSSISRKKQIKHYKLMMKAAKAIYVKARGLENEQSR